MLNNRTFVCVYLLALFSHGPELLTNSSFYIRIILKITINGEKMTYSNWFSKLCDMMYSTIETCQDYVTSVNTHNYPEITIDFEDAESFSNRVHISPLVLGDDELDPSDKCYDVLIDSSDDDEVVINLEAIWSK